MSLRVDSKRDIEFSFNLPEKRTQADWNNYIRDALEMLKIIPSDNYSDCPKALSIASLNDRQIKAIYRFWYGLDHLEESNLPMLRYAKKVLQLPATNNLLDKTHREWISITFKGQEIHKVTSGFLKALALESPYFKNCINTKKIICSDVDKIAFLELLNVCSSQKKIDLEKAPLVLPLAIKFQMKNLEQKYIHQIQEKCAKLFEEEKECNYSSKNKLIQFEKIISFVTQLENNFGWHTLPKQIIEKLESHFADLVFNEETFHRTKEIAQELSQNANRQLLLRNLLCKSLYENRSEFKRDEMWQIIQRLNPTELRVILPDTEEFKKILNIPGLKKLDIPEYTSIGFTIDEDDNNLSLNRSISEVSVTTTNSDINNNLLSLINLLPNVQRFQVNEE